MDEKALIELIDEVARDGRTELGLSGQGIKSLPPEIGKLTSLAELHLYGNQLRSLPSEIGELTRLSVLSLGGNRLTSLPPEIGKLTNLAYLYLGYNKLSVLTPEIGKLTKLEGLFLGENQLGLLPPEIGKLTNLKELTLWNNWFGSLPPEIGKLTKLTKLSLSGNQLSSLPPEIGRLTNLTDLYLSGNQLRSLPAEMGRLANLTCLILHGNRLASLPAGLGKLRKLRELGLEDNPLLSPPWPVAERGTQAVLVYLRERLKAPKRQWVSKLLLVGEGGVGKTSLLKRLLGEGFDPEEKTTHGIGVEELEVPHPKEAGVTMQLNTWDFGGQQIYHATHQFFLTNRALFVLVWDARHGWEAGKLYNWLDRIQARAPESPVLIVAAHIDERDADLPLEDLRRKYPQIRGHCKVSNKQGTGIEEFREKLAEVAADLPLMGEEWPAAWVDAAEAIRKLEQGHIPPKRLFDLMGEHDVTGESADVLAQWLHELGDILYFREDEELNDTVILNPVWVTEAISKVLESEAVVENKGILTREHRDRLWVDIDEYIRDHFLRLMERFDLSYRTLENREISLVVERLPLDPPDYQTHWDAIKEKEGCKEISMRFSLGSMQAGLPTWFIARSHRFSIHKHWRMGALFADGKEKRHLGLIEAYEYERYLRLAVRGPLPHNFFALLRDGLELTLARFPGLKIRRTVPCPGHDGGECKHEFDVEQLEGAFKENVTDIPCPETGFKKTVSVPEMLFGLHTERYDPVLQRMEEMESRLVAGHEEILIVSGELKAFAQRGFTSLFNSIQGLSESHCPNVFAVLPKDERGWLKNIFGQKMVLQLYCEAPGEWHPAVKGAKRGRYEIRRPGEFFKGMGPYILKLAKVIKYAAPVAGAAVGVAAAGARGGVIGAAAAKQITAEIKLMEELAKKLADRDYLAAELLERTGVGGKAERIEGMELRALRALLDKEDPAHEWGGLKKILTPEGHYLWLCEYHAEEYRN